MYNALLDSLVHSVILSVVFGFLLSFLTAVVGGRRGRGHCARYEVTVFRPAAFAAAA